MTTATINTSEGTRIFSVSFRGPQDQIVGAQGYSEPTWAADDNHLIVSLNTSDSMNCRVQMTGVPGTFTLTATSTRAGSPNVTGSVLVTVLGPPVDHINLDLVPL